MWRAACTPDSNPIDAVARAAARTGRRLHDVRHSARTYPTGSGKRRSGRRLLTVGTDCSIGKKYTALAIERELHRRQPCGGLPCHRSDRHSHRRFRCIAIDAVVSDFVSGAVETLTPENNPEHWDVIEGQGSLFHPSFAGVSLALLHGAQPDAFVVCHEPTRRTMRNVATPIADVGDVIEATDPTRPAHQSRHPLRGACHRHVASGPRRSWANP